MPWFEENRRSLTCSTKSVVPIDEVIECAFNGLDESAAYDLLDAVRYGSLDEFTRFDVRATFAAGTRAPLSLSIVAVGADEDGAATSLEITMKLSDVNNASLSLPPAPSAR